MFLNEELSELEKSIPVYHMKNPHISNRGVDWHIDHCLSSVTTIYKTLLNSNPTEFTWRFNFKRSLVFTTKFIPRGIGKAPHFVNSEEDIPEPTLLQKLIQAQKASALFDDLHEKHHFTHPVFGKLNREMSKQFIRIHTLHHIKIIRDIIQSKNKSIPPSE